VGASKKKAKRPPYASKMPGLEAFASGDGAAFGGVVLAALLKLVADIQTQADRRHIEQMRMLDRIATALEEKRRHADETDTIREETDRDGN
jgi:hypothetical protein